MYDWEWCMQLDDHPEIWQYDPIYKRENKFKLEWIERPVNLTRIRKFGVYFRNRDHHIVVIPKDGVFFIDGKKHKWKEFDRDKPVWLVYGRLNRAHIHMGTKHIRRDQTVHIVGYRQEGHFVHFHCLGVATDTGTYGQFKYEP